GSSPARSWPPARGIGVCYLRERIFAKVNGRSGKAISGLMTSTEFFFDRSIEVYELAGKIFSLGISKFFQPLFECRPQWSRAGLNRRPASSCAVLARWTDVQAWYHLP